MRRDTYKPSRVRHGAKCSAPTASSCSAQIVNQDVQANQKDPYGKDQRNPFNGSDTEQSDIRPESQFILSAGWNEESQEAIDRNANFGT